MVVTGWRSRASCAGDDDISWLRDEMTPDLALCCMSCPVRIECATEAISRSRDSDVGIWGGTTPSQRYAIREQHTTLIAAWRETTRIARDLYSPTDDD